MTTIQTLSNDIAALVAQTSPHIVRVDGRKRLGATGIALGDGIIATADHVIRTEGEITVGTDTESSASAQLIGRDPSTDLAFLKTDATLAKTPVAADSGQVGHLVLALGRPGQSVQATLGIISAIGDSYRTGMGGNIDQYIQTDVVMYPGFSGGPLINAAGEMIGMNTSGFSRGVSLTIPASTVQSVAAQILEHGAIKRGYLGISTQRAKLPRPLREQLHQRTGLLVVGVEADSPAAKAGLVMGDTIIAVANEKVGSHSDLLAQLSAERIGEKTPFTILRGGNLQSLDIAIGERA